MKSFYLFFLFVIFSNQLFSDEVTLDLSQPNDFKYVEDAYYISSGLIINDNSRFAKGAVWYKNMVNISTGFELVFKFRIKDAVFGGTDDGGQTGADGFALVFQNSSNTNIGATGGSMAYTGINNAFAIEFDQYRNTDENYRDWRDPNGNHIGVQYAKNSLISGEHRNPWLLASTNDLGIKSNGTIYYAKIKYDYLEKTFNVYFSSTETFSSPIITLNDFDIQNYYDIEKTDGLSFFGFTGSTGLATETHEIMELHFESHEISSFLCDSSMFAYQDFSETAGLKLNNDAYTYNKKLGLNYAKAYSSGSMYRDRVVPLVNGFQTDFAFDVCAGSNSSSKENSEPGADGFAFVIRNSDIDITGNSGGSIGYEGIENCLVIEYDMFNNNYLQSTDFNDPNGNHLGVFANKGMISPDHSSSSQIAVTKDIPIFKSDCSEKYYSRIVYKSTRKKLEIYLENNPNLIVPRIVLTDFDIKDYIDLQNNAKAFIGFTAATGNAYEYHNILNWSFCPDVYDFAMGASDESISDIEIFPNPADNYIKLNLPKGKLCDIQIFNTLGEIVYESNSQKGEVLINEINLLSKGVYMVVVSEGNRRISKQFIKR